MIPNCYATKVDAKGIGQVMVRPLEVSDTLALTTYFCGLSPATRSCYGPHPFDHKTAEALCREAKPAEPERFVAVIDGDAGPRIIGYMILTRTLAPSDVARYAQIGHALDARVCASFAPSIADSYQDQGLGRCMATHVLGCGPTLGLREVILMGGVLDRNPRAKHLYETLGFRVVGEFYSRTKPDQLNYDMILEYER